MTSRVIAIVFHSIDDGSFVSTGIDYINSQAGSNVTGITHNMAYAASGINSRAVNGKYFQEFGCTYDDATVGFQGADILNMVVPYDAQFVFFKDTGNGL